MRPSRRQVGANWTDQVDRREAYTFPARPSRAEPLLDGDEHEPPFTVSAATTGAPDALIAMPVTIGAPTVKFPVPAGECHRRTKSAGRAVTDALSGRYLLGVDGHFRRPLSSAARRVARLRSRHAQHLARCCRTSPGRSGPASRPLQPRAFGGQESFTFGGAVAADAEWMWASQRWSI